MEESIIISENIINNLDKYIISYTHVLIITDRNIFNIYQDNINKLITNNIILYTLEAGEGSKELFTIEKICNRLFDSRFPRKNSCIVGLGGGVVGDIAGFVANIYMRGIDLIHIPTTLLAMVDSSIGGKNGINTKYGKNLIGSFLTPKKILIDLEFLDTLPKIEFINGLAEVIKIAATSNKILWNFLYNNNLQSIYNCKDKTDLKYIICESVKTKVRIVKADKYEKNSTDINKSRMVLNFGHTFGHAIEKITRGKHGFCVAQGMILETSDLFNDNIIIKNKIISCLAKYELPIEVDNDIDVTLVNKYINNDKKGALVITLEDIGKPRLVKLNEILINKVFNKRITVVHHNRNLSSYPFSCPGSKSETNRILLLTALGTGTTIIKNPLLSDDTIHMIENLKLLGVKINIGVEGKYIRITGCAGKFPVSNPPKELFIGNSGTCMRFLLPILSTCLPTSDNTITIKGDKWMNKRPINELTNILSKGGVQLKIKKKNPPVILNLKNKFESECNNFHFENGISSQYISALMMAAPYFNTCSSFSIAKSYPSLTFIKLTYLIMLKFGIEISVEENSNLIIYIISSCKYTNPIEIVVEADATASIYPVVYALLHNLNIKINNIYENNKQGDFTLYKRLINSKDNIIDFDSSDTFMTYCVLFAFTPNTFKITNIDNQNQKECRRIDVTVESLKKCGIDICYKDGVITIHGKKEYPINDKFIYLDCHDDHRLVMSFALLASKMNNIVLSNYDAVKKTYPNFWKDMNNLGLSSKPFIGKIDFIERKRKDIIILIGMPSVGKTTYGEKLAKYLHLEFIDLDHEILKNLNISIPQFIQTHGWDSFRKIEYKSLENIISNKKNIVLSTGGGIIEYHKSRDLLNKFQYTILLEKDLELLKENSIYKMNMNELWNRRKSWYISSSNYSYYILNDYSSYTISYDKSEFEQFFIWMDKIMNKYEDHINSTFLSLPHNNFGQIIIDKGIDVIEYRYDLYPSDLKIAIFRLHSITNLPILFTDHSYSNLENFAQRYGCTLIDLDISKNIKLNNIYPNTFTIGSIHSDSYNQISESVASNAVNTDCYKIVSCMSVKNELDKLVKDIEQNKNIIYIFKGNEGRYSRIKNKFLTPVCLSDNNGYLTADGQLSIKELYDCRRTLFMDTDRMSNYCLFGKPISHSISPYLHNTFFKEQNYLGNYFKVETDDPEEVIDIFRKKNIRGASVTIPLKEELITYLDELSEDVKKIGAVNTLTLLKNGQIRGDNTDWMAIRDLILKMYLENTYILKNKIRCLVIGTGGAALSALYAVNKCGYELYIHGRNECKLKLLKSKFNAKVIPNINRIKMDIIIICVPGEVLVDLSTQINCKLIIEMAYNKIINRKFSKNIKLVDGKEVLKIQAKYQNRIWNTINYFQ